MEGSRVAYVRATGGGNFGNFYDWNWGIDSLYPSPIFPLSVDFICSDFSTWLQEAMSHILTPHNQSKKRDSFFLAPGENCWRGALVNWAWTSH